MYHNDPEYKFCEKKSKAEYILFGAQFHVSKWILSIPDDIFAITMMDQATCQQFDSLGKLQETQSEGMQPQTFGLFVGYYENIRMG